MYSFLPSTATRAEPIEWTRLMTNALAVVKAVPSEQAANALAMMQSYAAASPTVFTSLTHGARDVKEYVGLLVALDDVVAQWPLRMRQLLGIPAVALVSAGGGVNGSLVTVPVRTPRGEALVVLLNVAVGHLENALGYLARVRADTESATSVSTPQGGSVAAPNQNAKLAAQHCRHAVEALQWAEALHVGPASPSAVTLQQLRSQLPLEVTHGMAVLCAAVAKYMYALSSASTKNKPDVLAKLAFEAAQLPLPTSVLPSSSLQLLPSLLLAAYHYHEATWYYGQASTRGPEMAQALGHARYADSLLRTCDAHWSVESAHREAEDESRQWWGRRLASLFSGARGNTKKGSSRGASAKHPRAEATNADGDDNGDGDDDGDPSAAPLRPATQYPHLHALLLGQMASSPVKKSKAEVEKTSFAVPVDVVQVYPYVRLLLHDVCTALQQYERENRVVYFAKVAAADEVRRDVPDVAAASLRGEAAMSASEAAAFESRAGLFASLPSPAALQAALAQQEEVGQAQQALSRALQRVERDGRLLSAYVTPTAALEQALDALEALLPAADDWANPKGAVAVAADAVEAAFKTFKTTAAAWQEAHDAYVGDHQPPPAVTQETEHDVVAWSERATAALAQWAALRIPATAKSRTALVTSLVYRSADMRAYLEQVEGLSRDVRDVLAAETSTVTREQVQSAVDALVKVKQVGTELLAAAAVDSQARSRLSALASASAAGGGPSTEEEEAEDLNASPQYEKAEAAVLAVVDVLQEAPMVVARIEHATAQLREMQQKAVVTPLGLVRDVRFRGTAAEQNSDGKNQRTSAEVSKPAKRRVADLNPTTTTTTATTPTATATAASSSPSISSRKRDRDVDIPSVKSASSASGDEDASVASSQLGDAEEIAPTPADGATRAAVSGTLLSRMRANKAHRQSRQAKTSAGRAASPTRKGASPAGATEKAAKAEKNRAKR